MQREQAREILKKYIDGTATEEEKLFLEAWYLQFELKELPEIDDLLKQEQLDRIRLAVLAHSNTKQTKTYQLWPRIAAASIIFLLSFGAYLIFRPTMPVKQLASIKHDILPGRNQATLTLANGQKIILIKGLSGKLAVQGQTNIFASNNRIIYSATSSQTTVSYNTMVTVR